jgi:predicted nucleic-acid-binding protein
VKGYGLDTSALVRLLVGEPAVLSGKVHARLAKAFHQREVVIASDLALAEATYALKYHYGHESSEIRKAMLAMLTSGLVRPEPGSAALWALQQPSGGKAGFVDRLIGHRYEADELVTLTLDRAQSKRCKSEYLG